MEAGQGLLCPVFVRIENLRRKINALYLMTEEY